VSAVPFTPPTCKPFVCRCEGFNPSAKTRVFLYFTPTFTGIIPQGFTAGERDAGEYYRRYVKGITGMDTKAHKCPSSKKAYTATKISQIYCSARCRQAAYQKRKQQKARPRRNRGEQLAVALTCDYCNGTFWAKGGTARFCSTSCRTLYHRALRAAIPHALSAAYGVPPQKAADMVETQPIQKIRGLLQAAGYASRHQQREWIRNNRNSLANNL